MNVVVKIRLSWLVEPRLGEADRRDVEYYNIIMLYINTQTHRLIITGNVRPDTAPEMRLHVTDSGESRANKVHSG